MERTPSREEREHAQKMRRLGGMVVSGTFVLGFSLGNLLAIVVYLR